MNIILADSVAMHGDLINTQDSAANQWRAIQNAVKDNLTTLGQHFMPVFLEVLGWMRKGVDFAIDFTKSLHASSGETSRLSDVIGALNTIFQITWNIVKPLVKLLVNHLAWSFKNVLSPVVATLTDVWTSWIGKVQEGYNWLARLVPGLDEVAVATVDVSEATDILGSTTMPAATEATEDMALALHGAADAAKEAAKETAEAAEAYRQLQADQLHDYNVFVFDRSRASRAAVVAELKEAAKITEAYRLEQADQLHDYNVFVFDRSRASRDCR